jgi:hypothetical protein
VLVLLLVVAVLVVVVVIIQGSCWRLVPVPFGVAKVAGAPVWAAFPPCERVLVWGRDGEVGVPPQMHRQEGSPLAYLPHALQPFAWDRGLARGGC